MITDTVFRTPSVERDRLLLEHEASQFAGQIKDVVNKRFHGRFGMDVVQEVWTERTAQ